MGGDWWTKDRDDALIELALNGLGNTEIGKQLGISRSSVKNRLRRLRKKTNQSLNQGCRWWTQSRDNTLMELSKVGLNSVEIADKMGTTRNAVNNRLSRLRIKTGDKTVGTSRLWKTELNAELIRLAKLGYSGSVIAEKLGVSRGAVSGRIKRLRRSSGDDAMRLGRSVCRPSGGSSDGPLRKNSNKRPSVPKIVRRPVPGGMMNANKFVCCGSPVTILDLNHRVCCWPIWLEGTTVDRKQYCGNAVQQRGASRAYYCDAHDAIATAKVSGINESKGPANWKVKQWGRAA